MGQLPSDLSFQRFDAAGARAQRDTVALVHGDAYADRMASGGTFDSRETFETFMARFDAYASREGFDLVIGYLHGEPVGQSWGWALTPNSAWWRGMRPEPEPGFTVEDGTRTFALSEIMVRQNWTGRGIAHALHDELLRGRHETRATLLVRPENATAYRAYTRWGWSKVAQLRPGWPDAPLMDVLTVMSVTRIVTLTTCSSPEPALRSTVARLAKACRACASKSAPPTVLPCSSTAAWPETNTRLPIRMPSRS